MSELVRMGSPLTGCEPDGIVLNNKHRRLVKIRLLMVLEVKMLSMLLIMILVVIVVLMVVLVVV